MNSHTYSTMTAELRKLSEDVPTAAPVQGAQARGGAPAETSKPVKPRYEHDHPALTLAKGVGAYGLGTGLAYAGLLGANELSKQYRGKPLVSGGTAMTILPAAAGVGAIMYQHMNDLARERMRLGAEERR